MTVHLDAAQLTLRGEIRARIERCRLANVAAAAHLVRFDVDGDVVELELGRAEAERCVEALRKPSPSLAAKLGIAPATRLYVTDAIDDDALSAAIASAGLRASGAADADIAIVRTDDAAKLAARIEALCETLPTPPVWVVYAKGRNAPLGETAVREIVRQYGFVDTKVAAVSDQLSAARFTRRAVDAQSTR